MDIKFVIDPLLYGVMLTLEIIGMYLICRYLTRVEAEKKRWLIGTVLTVLIILLLDIFVFKYHKGGFRSLIFLSLFLVYLKAVNQISWIKAIKQLLIVFVVLLTVDLSVQLLANSLFLESLDWLYSYFSYMYAIYLAILYLIIALISITNVKVLDLR